MKKRDLFEGFDRRVGVDQNEVIELARQLRSRQKHALEEDIGATEAGEATLQSVFPNFTATGVLFLIDAEHELPPLHWFHTPAQEVNTLIDQMGQQNPYREKRSAPEISFEDSNGSPDITPLHRPAKELRLLLGWRSKQLSTFDPRQKHPHGLSKLSKASLVEVVELDNEYTYRLNCPAH